MANAKKCDVCGNYYDYYKGIDPIGYQKQKIRETYGEQLIHELRICNSIRLCHVPNHNDNTSNLSVFDLCPHCMAKVIDDLGLASDLAIKK